MGNLNDSEEGLSASSGNLFVIQHSIMKSVVKFVSTNQSPEKYVTELVNNTRMPGSYAILYNTYCNQPNDAKDRIMHALRTSACPNDFYEVDTQIAINMIKRESMRIPVIYDAE
ncbi:hypothetical protein HII17_13440 [Thalassotalea sp. M1531]|uniref:Uncharacterized protein n=1 Tax=Thalassotalea algicola TaxID=2716224 RepID=A0A7Y0LE76_9GAMM|nr:hypothetical protein [Thalassotalea algicola]NMP32564.1 hypothetical protein [Thalassotalea algicola]